MSTPLATTEYVWNEHRTDLSHLVPSIQAFGEHRDAATICGLLTSVADLHAAFDLCPVCVKGADA